MSIHYLKIKVTSLAAEIRLIHREEARVKPSRSTRRRLKKYLEANTLTRSQRIRIERRIASRSEDQVKAFWGLRHHRMDLRPESRAAQLAYGFLRGKTYLSMETKARSRPWVGKIEALILKYGPPGQFKGDIKESVKAWMDVPAAPSTPAERSD